MIPVLVLVGGCLLACHPHLTSPHLTSPSNVTHTHAIRVNRILFLLFSSSSSSTVVTGQFDTPYSSLLAPPSSRGGPQAYQAVSVSDPSHHHHLSCATSPKPLAMLQQQQPAPATGPDRSNSLQRMLELEKQFMVNFLLPTSSCRAFVRDLH